MALSTNIETLLIAQEYNIRRMIKQLWNIHLQEYYVVLENNVYKLLV